MGLLTPRAKRAVVVCVIALSGCHDHDEATDKTPPTIGSGAAAGAGPPAGGLQEHRPPRTPGLTAAPVLQQLLWEVGQPAQDVRARFGDKTRLVVREDGRLRVYVLVTIDETVSVDLRAVEGEDVHRYGPVLTALLPVDRVPDLVRLPGVVTARASRLLDLRLEKSVPASGPNQGISLPSPGPTQGGGAVVGVIDSGVDWTHRDFQTPGGTSRIISSMNQTEDPMSGALQYGDVTQPSTGEPGHADKDTGVGHGTHVASIAAGNGNVSPGYVGVAAGADIVAVSAPYPAFSDIAVLIGTQHVFDVAAAVGKPAVANLSLGGHFGAHDGSDALDRALSAIAGPGRIVVAAAGNEGADIIHTAGLVNVTSGTAGGAQFVEWDHLAMNTLVYFNFWYDSAEPLNVWIQHGAGTSYPTSGALARPDSMVLSGGGDTVLVVLTEAPDPVSGKSVIYGYSRSRFSRTWRLRVAKAGGGNADANLHGWLFAGTGSYRFTSAGTFVGDTASTMATPATAFDTISVASYATEAGSWGAPPNLSGFSSRGPTADGRTIDIAAPGSIITAAKSSDVGGEEDYHDLSGTSMAAPHVTGLVALMLDQQPSLDPAAVRSLLCESARFDGGESPSPGSLPSNAWGCGKATAGPKGTSAGALAETDGNHPRVSGSSHAPATVGASTTVVAVPGSFTPREPTATQHHHVRWQRQRVASDCAAGEATCNAGIGRFFDIPGANTRALGPNFFSPGDVLRAAVTPLELHNGYRLGYFHGTTLLSSPFTVTSDTAAKSHAPEVGWNLVAVPTTGAGTDATLANFHAGRFWRWNETTAAYESVVDHAGVNDLARGVGYFTWVADAGTQGTLSTTDALPDETSDFLLTNLTVTAGEHAGKHLIGNPWNKVIYWQNLRVRPTGGGPWTKITQAGSLISAAYWADYANSPEEYLMNTVTPGGLTGAIAPWHAFWIKAAVPIDLSIPASQPLPSSDLSGGHGLASLSTGPHLDSGGLHAGEAGDEDHDDTTATARAPAPRKSRGKILGRDRLAALPAWSVRLSAASGRLRDTYNWIGLRRDADNGFDSLDISDGGSAGAASVQLYVDRSSRDEKPGRFCRDLQRLTRAGRRTWPLAVRSRNLSTAVVLTWGPPPDGWTLELVDRVDGTRIDMRQIRAHTFSPASADDTRALTVVATPPPRAGEQN